MPPKLKLLDAVPDEARDHILADLKAFNNALMGPSDRRDMFIPLYDDAGEIEGGLVGYTGRGWLYIEMLLVPETLRGQGLAGKLLAVAESEARRRRCIGAYIDTINPIALKTYEKAGFAVFGKLDGFSNGLAINWLMKRFE